MLLERAHAKINLTLDVLGKRPDGYHEVDMVMQTIDLSDLIWLEEIPGRNIEVDSNVSHIPRDSRNLAVAAAEALLRRLGMGRGLRIRIEKYIPVAAGLAGGSADAAAVLRGLNRLWNLALSLSDLAEIGAEVGSDVPFCVYGGCAIAKGRGERIERLSHSFRPWVVLVKPPVFVSTAEVYRAVQPEEYSTAPASGAMVEALQRADLAGVQAAVHNGLCRATWRLYPEVARLADRVRNVATVPVHMSGSGPTLYCLLHTQNAAQRLYNALRGFVKEVYLCRVVS